MQIFANRRIRIRSKVITVISRKLAGKGNFLVQEGQEVSPHDVIGRSSLSAGFRLINVATALEISPQEVKKLLTKSIDQRIYKGELLAYKPGKFFQGKKVLVSPTDGVIESYNDQTGELRLSFLPKVVELASSVYGVVEKIDTKSGQLFIRTEATEIFGLCGSGRSREGILEMVGTRSGLVDVSKMNPQLSEHIVVGGGLVYNEAIVMAVSFGVSGIITGGINAKDYKSVAGGSLNLPGRVGTDVGISIMACEGFGSIPIGEDISKQMLDFRGRFAILNGNETRLILPSHDPDCRLRIRKTKIPMTTISYAPILEAWQIEVGQSVRVIGSPFMGEQGRIMMIDQSSTLLPSGINTYMVTIETKNRKIKIPFSNIEII